MKQIAVLSGKGGTGKTTITAAFAALAKKAILADCDVDAPDLHMLLHPEVIETMEFKGSKLAFIDENKCIKCSACQEKCRFEAITSFRVNPFSCEGCGVCSFVCPVNAITLKERISGYAYISKIKYGFMVHALLKPGESNSGKLVTLVRQKAKILAEKEKSNLVIIDGPPGIGCPVIASLSGIDAGILVTEPTLSGIHDLMRVIQLMKHFGVRAYVCINMYDVNLPNANKILRFCRENDIKVIGRLPFNPVVTEAMVNEKTIIEYSPESNVAKEIAGMWKSIREELGMK